MFCRSGGWKSRLAKTAGAETSGEMGAEKLHAAVAPSRFGSQNAKSTSLSKHLWKLRSGKGARGAKYMPKPNCSKHLELRSTFGR